MRIAGSIALVTGANRGLGRVFVEALVSAGASKVYACARHPESLDGLFQQFGARVAALQVDVTDSQTIENAVEQAGDVTLLINNAGVLEAKGLIEAGTLEPMMREMDVNVYGVARMSLAFSPILKANGGGAIVNILSTAAWVNVPCFGSYSASKAAARSLTHCLRYELQENNTRVFGVYAGPISTSMLGFVEVDKTDPVSIVRETLAGIEADTLDIDADETSKSSREALRTDPAGLEAATIEWSRHVKALKSLE